MHQLEIKGTTGASTLLVGERITNLADYLPFEKSVIITDDNVKRHYSRQLPPVPMITIGTGEGIKTLETVAEIYQELVTMEADRSTFIVAVGGGIVCDIAGFVASTYLRGVRFGFAATSLLAQVDASVGGKNGVNFSGYKNMVGVFNQPEFVLCDMAVLHTLPEKEIRCGFAEIIKHAAIADEQMIPYLEDQADRALALDAEVIEALVYHSVKTKADVVQRDEKEKGERRKLNFGHTFGHAFEKTLGISHGEAVGAGMAVAADLSVKKGLLTAPEGRRLKAIIEKYHLPTKLDVDKIKVIDAVRRDKKREARQIHCVLLNRLGQAVIEPITIEELDELTDDLF